MIFLSGFETFEKWFPLSAGFKVKSKIPDFERGETQRLGKRGRFSKVSILDSQESSLICKNKPNSAKTGYYAKSYNHLDGFYAISMRSQ
jgi:hypothetical protein